MAGMKPIRRLFVTAIGLTFFLAAGCAPFYFESTKPPAEPLRFASIEELPYREIWSGFVFNGEKVGFTYMNITQLPESQLFRVTSEARMRILFLGIDRKVSLKSVDIVRPDLTLVSFHYEQDIDGKLLTMDGALSEGLLRAAQKSGDEEKVIEKKIDAPLYPTSVINLYPVVKGLTVGAQYRFTVFDLQTQSVAEVSQRIITFEESKKLILEPAFRVETSLHGHEVTSWINKRGETILELGMGGVLITHKEEEEQARRYLFEASLNKKDILLDFSAVKTAAPLDCPREALAMDVKIDGLAGEIPLLQGPGQTAWEIREDGTRLAFFRIVKQQRPSPDEKLTGLDTVQRNLYISSTHHLESNHPEIRKKALEITAGTATPRAKVERLSEWVAKEIKDEAVNSFSALEVLHSRKGECQAHTMLYTALARACGIPTRIVGGLVYMEGVGFLYHSWAESWVDGWEAVDPTFNQVPVDATHIKLVEGHDWTSILNLGKVIGRLKATVTDYRTSCSR